MCTQKEHIPLQSQCIDVHVQVKKKGTSPTAYMLLVNLTQINRF